MGFRESAASCMVTGVHVRVFMYTAFVCGEESWLLSDYVEHLIQKVESLKI